VPDGVFDPLDLEHAPYGLDVLFANGELAVEAAPDEVDLLTGRDAQRAIEPEPVDRALDLFVPVIEIVEPALHARLADPARDVLEAPDARSAHSALEDVVGI